MLFSELYKIIVSKVTFVDFMGGLPQSPSPLDPPLFLMYHWFTVSFDVATFGGL